MSTINSSAECSVLHDGVQIRTFPPWFNSEYDSLDAAVIGKAQE